MQGEVCSRTMMYWSGWSCQSSSSIMWWELGLWLPMSGTPQEELAWMVSKKKDHFLRWLDGSDSQWRIYSLFVYWNICTLSYYLWPMYGTLAVAYGTPPQPLRCMGSPPLWWAPLQDIPKGIHKSHRTCFCFEKCKPRQWNLEKYTVSFFKLILKSQDVSAKVCSGVEKHMKIS